MEQIHGHEVMHMMVNSGASYSKESLKQAIHQQFGKETRFYTCSAENMTADDLITFLANKGKFNPVGEGFNTAPENICNH